MRINLPRINGKCAIMVLSLAILFGCEDDTKPTPVAPTTDAQASMLDASTPGNDMAMVETDQAVAIDMATIDAEIVDTFVEQEPDIGPILIQDDECAVPDDCGQYERCVGGLCKLDLRPDVFRVNSIEVIEPKLSAAFLESTLMVGVNNGQLTLLVEPGRYDENGNGRWYMGNGNGIEPYVYLHRFPIQTFEGAWRCIDTNVNGQCDEGESPFWNIDEETRFELIVPTSSTENGEQCYSRMTTQVGLRIEPITGDDGTTQLAAELSGYLLRRDADSVTFSLNGLEYRLLMFLQDEDFNVNALCNADGTDLTCDDFEPACPELLVPEVRDGCFTGQCVSWADCCPGGIPGCDGQPDGYPFHFKSVAIPIIFADEPPTADDSNRDASPMFNNPLGCP